MIGTAVWFVAPRCAELRYEDLKAPGPDELLVRTSVSLVSAGTEMLVYRGETTEHDLLPTMSRGTFAFPIKYGYQCVGLVEQAGSTTRFRPGQRVFATHPHQDLLVIPGREDLVFPIPDSVSDDAAAFTNLLRVAIDGLHTCPVKIGDVVVVYGQGVVGMLCARLARRTASRVIVVDPLASRRTLALEYGADVAVGPDEARAAVVDVSQGRGADIAIEASGAPSALQSAIEVTGSDGTVLAISYYGTRPVQLRLAPEFHFRRLSVVSSQGGGTARWDRQRRSEAALELLQSMPTAAMISHRVSFREAARAYTLIDGQHDSTLGVVLDYGDTGGEVSRW